MSRIIDPNLKYFSPSRQKTSFCCLKFSNMRCRCLFPSLFVSHQEENGEAFQIIEVQVLSNWGHEEYTCMYRFRVHGTPGDV